MVGPKRERAGLISLVNDDRRDRARCIMKIKETACRALERVYLVRPDAGFSATRTVFKMGKAQHG